MQNKDKVTMDQRLQHLTSLFSKCKTIIFAHFLMCPQV